MTHLTDEVKEEGIFYVTAGTTFTPNTLTWRLMNRDGDVINSRATVSVSSPSTASQIIAYGDDLAVPDESDVRRYILTKGTYTASSLPFTDMVSFDITKLKGITT